MHPRNIYNKLPDFNELSKKYPEFAKIAKVDLSGKIKIDFSDLESKLVLTKCCLHKDFQLTVELPKNRLCPTLPLRLNYIHFIEDLLEHCKISEDISGVDIGTGSSAIYCLLSARMHNDWKMYGLEVDEENLNFASQTINENNLNDQIKIISQDKSEKIFEKLFESDENVKTFCLCNPPFYGDAQEMTETQNRTGKRPKVQHEKPSHETVTEGGELAFVTKIFNESLELKEKIRIYSTMFGCKRNFEKFLTHLKDEKIENFTTTRFIQGKVNRWAVAWSFCENIKNFKDYLSKNSEKSTTVLKHVIEGEEISKIVEKVKEILNNLKIEIKIVTERTSLYEWELKAVENTWSNQRRKRRAEERNQDINLTPTNQDLTMGLEISKSNNKILILAHFISGSMNKDCVNQILQFIKNKLK